MASTSTFRKLILNVHLWVGLVAAVLLVLIGGSGALLVFETQIDQALNPKLVRVTPTGTMLSLTELKTALERQYPGYRVLDFGISESDDTAYSAYLEPASGNGLDLAVDQYSGKALGVWDNNRFARKLHGFHTHLLAGNVGSAIVAWGAIFLLFLSISGLILWWRSKIFGVSLQSSGPKFQYDLHSTIGIMSSLFLLAFSLTGIVVHWEDAAGRLAKRISHMPSELSDPHPAKPAPGVAPLEPTQLLLLAKEAVPGARATTVALPDSPASPALVILKYPEDRTPAGRTRIFLDPYSGKILSLANSRAWGCRLCHPTQSRDSHR